MEKILIVEDNAEISDLLAIRLEAGGYEVSRVSNGLDVVSKLMKKEQKPDAVVLDLMIPGRSGYELINSIRSIWRGTRIFVFSSHGEYKKQIPEQSVDGFFLKTEGIENLISAMNKELRP